MNFSVNRHKLRRDLYQEDVFCRHRTNGQVAIVELVIDVSSRDDIPLIWLGLQQIYTDRALREAVFNILEEVVSRKEEEGGRVARYRSTKGLWGWSNGRWWCWVSFVLG